MIIRPALPEERQTLEDVQRRASLALGDYREQLEASPDAIELPAEHVESALVAEIDGRVAGFAVLLVGELNGLFIEPAYWRQGVGSALIAAAVHQARKRGLSLVTVVAGPGARPFYEKCGFKAEGEVQTRFGPAISMSR